MENPIVLNDAEVAAVAGGCSVSINIINSSFNDAFLILGSSVINSFDTNSFNIDSFNTIDSLNTLSSPTHRGSRYRRPRHLDT